MSWMSKKTGKPKQEGGHKRINISINKFTNEALQKIRKDNGNISKFIEKQLKPTLEKLDPGEASIHIWRIEIYLAQQIILATQQNKPEITEALASIAVALKNFRSLCGLPPADFDLTSTPIKPVVIIKKSELDKARAYAVRRAMDMLTG